MKTLIVLGLVALGMLGVAPSALALDPATLSIDLVSANPVSKPGWTNTTTVGVAWAGNYNYQEWQLYQNGAWTNSQGPVPNPVVATIGGANKSHEIGMKCRIWYPVGNGWAVLTSNAAWDTITLDTVRPRITAGMSKKVYTVRQRPQVRYYVRDASKEQASAIVKRAGIKAGVSKAVGYRNSWTWRTLSLIADTRSTYFRRGTYSVSFRTRDMAGNSRSYSLRFSVK